MQCFKINKKSQDHPHSSFNEVVSGGGDGIYRRRGQVAQFIRVVGARDMVPSSPILSLVGQDTSRRTVALAFCLHKFVSTTAPTLYDLSIRFFALLPPSTLG